MLVLLLNNKEFLNLINEKNYLNATPFHSACLESMMCTILLLKNRNKIRDLKGNTPEHYAFFGGRIDIYNQIATSDIKEFNEYINSIRNGDKENLNEEKLLELDKEDDYLNNLCISLNNGNISDTKKIIKYYQKNQKLKKIFILKNNLTKIIKSMCNGRNPFLLSLISEIINFDNIPIAAYIGKYGLISYIEEMKNMNINMFSELDKKSLLDFAIENKSEDMILEFLKNLDEISNDKLSKYLTKILMRSKKLFNSIYNYIISEEKFSKNQINFDYLYNEDSLPIYFKIFLKLDKVDINSLDLNKVKNNCRNSVILELQKQNYQIINQFEDESLFENKIFKQLLDKNSNSKFNSFIFEHDVEKFKDLLKHLKNYNLFLQHQIIKSQKIWILKYLPKEYNLFIKNDEGKICFQELKEDFDDFKLLLNVFIYREEKIENQMFYFLKAIELHLENSIKKNKKLKIEIILKKKILNLMECFEKNNEYLKNYCNDKNNNILNIISKSYYMDKEMEDKFLSFIDLIKNSINKNEFIKIINQQNNFGNIFLFNIIDNNHHRLSKVILEKYFDYFDLSIRNNNGNSFLHYLMSIKCYDKNIFNFITKIIKFNKYFIISKNNNGLTPFHKAAYNKCNDSLILMSHYFPLEQVEIISNKGNILHYAAITNSLSILRLIIENFKMDINSQIHNKNDKIYSKNKNNSLNLPNKSTPIYCAAYFSCIDSFDFLLSLGANPFIQDENGDDAIDAALIHGNKKMINYISKTYSFINSNGKYLLSLVKNVHARHILYDNFYLLGSQNINITNTHQKTY